MPAASNPASVFLCAIIVLISEKECSTPPADPKSAVLSSAKSRYNSRMHNGFTQELARWGPQARYDGISRAQAQSYCTQLARTHYENFSVATLLLPRRLTPH